MIVKAVKEKSFNELMEEIDKERLYEWFKENMYNIPLHPLRKILNENNAKLLGRMMDMFDVYKKNRWKIENAIRNKSFSDLPKGFDPLVFLNFIVYNKAQSNPKYMKQNCPEKFK